MQISMQTILVVEDDISIAEVMVDILEDTGYQVVVAGNGQEALAYLEDLESVGTFETAHPDLILSDIMMPVMDGRELCKRLHANPAYSSIPRVMMSAAYGSINLDGCERAAFLKKPFGIKDLLATVSKVIG